MKRRRFLADLGRTAALAATTPTLWRLRWLPRFADNPFQLGVASGDPLPNGAVLWTRLATRPLDPDGGMADDRVVVRWEVADDDRFARVRSRGSATAVRELAHSVHVEVGDLAPDRWYFYRFMSGDAVSPVGWLRTAPPDDAEQAMRFAFVSCQHYEQGLYTAFGHVANEEIDFLVHLGDYIYEGAATTGRSARKHVGPLLRTLADYRQRYALYKSDPLLQLAHARCPWLVIWDDHEVRNNYSAFDHDAPAGDAAEQRDRRGAAYQAWWEHQPVRIAATRDWPDLRIYRTMNWGRLARFWAIDDRQYRSDQACGDGSKAIPCGDWDDPGRAMLGPQQERWLVDGLGASRARWQVLANQVILSPPDEQPRPGDRVDMDKWSGYPAERDRILAAIAERARDRTVVITGDVHSNWVYDTRRGFDQSARPSIAAEFVGTSISSGGDGSDAIRGADTLFIARNPSLRWTNNRRGYVVCAANASEWRAEYRVVPFVMLPDAPLQTVSKWLYRGGRLESA